MSKTVTIVGGGLAGLTLGIGLRQHNVPVMIHEAGHYPRHRVCGEFISGRGQATLARLGLTHLLEQAGSVRVRTTAFYSVTRKTAPRPLPEPAICLSRFILDAALAGRFRELGGELCEGSRRGDFGEGMVRATGRRAPSGGSDARWFGLKIHARKVALEADLEMHLSRRGYIGLGKINDDEVNVCGLFRKEEAKENGRELLYGPLGSPIRERLEKAEFVEDSYCAVGGISLCPERAAARAEICLGDTVTMIPPITGNGMSMAFESAEMAIMPLVAWSGGERSWEETRRKIARDCDMAFTRRLAWAKWWQRIILTPVLQNPMIGLVQRWEWIWRMAFEGTR